MAKEMTDNELLAQLGDRAKKALDASKTSAPPPQTGGDLPAGIEGGIAQLNWIGFKKIKEGSQNEGKLMFYADAIVKRPVEHGGIIVEGLRTRITENLFDTPTSQGRKTLEEHLEHVQHVVKRMLGKGEHVEAVGGDAITQTMALLRKRKPHFRFRTWKSSKQVIIQGTQGSRTVWFAQDEDGRNRKGPYQTQQLAQAANPFAGREARVQHVWGERIDFQDDSSAEDHVEDHSEAPGPSTNGTTQSTPAAKPVKGKKQVPPPEPEPDTTEESQEEAFDEFGDIDSLLAKANKKDKDAQTTLSAMAVQAGVSEDDVKSAESWEDVIEMMKAAKSSATATADPDEADEEGAEESEEADEAEPEDSDEPVTPGVGEIWKYRPVGKNGKKVAKPIQVEVVKVSTKNETAQVKNLTTDKMIEGHIPFADLDPLTDED